MDSIKERLKRFLLGSHKNHDLNYDHYFRKGEFVEFSITSQANDEYFFVESINGEKSVRGFYRLTGMEEDDTIVVDILEIRDDGCILMFRAFDRAKIEVTVAHNTDERKVSACLL